MSKHTPGPWFVTSEDDRPTGSVGTSPISNDIALTWSESCAKADARLIASAPELLEALRFVATLTEGSTTGSDFVMHERACAAIAKATGDAT